MEEKKIRTPYYLVQAKYIVSFQVPHNGVWLIAVKFKYMPCLDQ